MTRKGKKEIAIGRHCRSAKDGRIFACRGSATKRLRACGRTQDYGSIKYCRNQQDEQNAQTARSCMLPTERRRSPPEALYELFRDWQRIQTQSLVKALRSPRLQMDVWFCRAQEPMPRGTLLRVKHPETVDLHALPSAPGTPVPSLDR